MADEEVDYEKIAKAIKEVSDVSTRRYELEIAQAKQIKKLYADREDAEKNLKEIIAQNNIILELEVKVARANFNEALEQMEKQRTLVKEYHKEQLAAQKERNNAIAAGDETAEAFAILRLKRAKVLKEIAQKEIVSSKIRAKQSKKQVEATSNVSDANKGFQSSLRSVLKTTTGLTGEIGGLTGAFIKFGEIDDPKDKAKIFDNLKKTFKATVNPLTIGHNLLSKVFQSTLHFMKEFDKLAADFRKNTGIIDRGFDGIEQRIVNVQRANIRMGVSMNEAFQAAGSLTSEMASFTGMTDKSQASVLQAATVLQEFGVGAQTTAQIFNNFSKGLGYNANQLEKLSTQLMGISTSLKIPPQIIATEFNAASKELMKYGGDMVNVFKGIAEQSKQTGIAMGELLGIVKQFDTFEGAGAAVGKLNAILGGPYLNSINMLYATEEDRVKMLRESVALSGKQFNELSRFEKQAIAAAAGITDMTVAGNLFGGTSSEFAKTQMSMKEMQERAAKAQSVTEKFTQVMQSFAIALGPAVHILGDLLEGLVIILNPFTELTDLGDEFGGTANIVANGVYLIVGSLLLLRKGIIAIKVEAAMMFAGFAAVIAGFLVFKKVIEALEGPMKVFAAVLGAIAAVAAIATIVSTGGLAAAPIFAGLQLLGLGAGLGTISALPSFDSGKEKGTPVRRGAGLVGEKGSEMVVTEDGSRYMVDSPSVMALDKNDTVYSNAETKAMLSNGSSNDSGAAIAEMRQMIGELARSQQQQSAAADRRVEAMLDRPVVVAVNDKKLFETMKPQLNRALGLSRTGGVV